MEDVRIVEDGITNYLTVGTTKRSRKDKSTNVTSEKKIDKDIALITDIPSVSETVLLCTEICKDVWIADLGASSHMTNTLQVMYNQHPK